MRRSMRAPTSWSATGRTIRCRSRNRGKPVFYGLGNFSFHTGHGGRKHGDWVGMLVRASAGRAGIERVTFQFVRHNDRNETVPSDMAKEAEELADIVTRSAPFDTKFVTEGNEVRVELSR